MLECERTFARTFLPLWSPPLQTEKNSATAERCSLVNCLARSSHTCPETATARSANLDQATAAHAPYPAVNATPPRIDPQ